MQDALLSAAINGDTRTLVDFIHQPNYIIALEAIEQALALSASSGHLDTTNFLLAYAFASFYSMKDAEEFSMTTHMTAGVAAIFGHLHLVNDLFATKGYDQEILHFLNALEKAHTKKQYHVVSYFIGLQCVIPVSIAQSPELQSYLSLEKPLLRSANPLVYDFPLAQFDKLFQIKTIHGAMEMILCATDIPSDIVFLLAHVMLGKEFTLKNYLEAPLPSPLNLDIKPRIAEHYETYSKLTSTWLALIEANQLPEASAVQKS